MARLGPDYFSAFRFIVDVPGYGLIGCSAVFNDIFGGGVWLGKGQLPDKSLKEVLALRVRNTIDVWMIVPGKDEPIGRKITIHFDNAVEWFPLFLDAASSDVAKEWVRLSPVILDGPEDLRMAKLPEHVAEAVAEIFMGRYVQPRPIKRAPRKRGKKLLKKPTRKRAKSRTKKPTKKR